MRISEITLDKYVKIGQADLKAFLGGIPMKNYPKQIKNTLCTVIRNMAKHPEDFCRCPEKDFTRNRKLPLEKVLALLVKMGGHSLRNEMLDCLDFKEMPASVSALVQQRSKILPEAMEYLFREFTNRGHEPKTYKEYRLLAVDGSDLQFTANPNDPLSYFPGANGQKPYSILHMNALYDLNSNLYLDAVVQKRRAANENAALVSMVDRSEIHGPVILTADRGYESYNTLEHIARKGWKYVIRLRESKGIVSALSLPNGDFDMPVQLFLTRKQGKKLKELQKDYPGQYRFLPINVNFDYLPWGTDGFYPFSFRIVRFKISEDSTETLITNLDSDSFSADELKRLYHLRWSIETSFRQLKYTIGLSLFQSKKVEYITQEIFARLTMYNFCELITSHVVIQNKRRKYVYQTNFAAAVHICRQFLRGAVSPPKVEALIEQQVIPIRPGRSTPRKTKNIKFNSFFYRIA